MKNVTSESWTEEHNEVIHKFFRVPIIKLLVVYYDEVRKSKIRFFLLATVEKIYLFLEQFQGGSKFEERDYFPGIFIYFLIYSGKI